MTGIDSGSLPLVPGESLLWTGHPARTAVVFGGRDLVRVPFGVAFTAFVAYVVVRGLASGTAGPVTALLVVVAMYFSVGRFVLNWYLRRGTRYFLTTKRLVIHRRSFGRTQSVERAMADVMLIERKIGSDGSGTIRFDPEPDRFGLFPHRRHSDWHDLGLHGLQFFRIPDAAAVIELIEASTSFRAEPGSQPHT